APSVARTLKITAEVEELASSEKARTFMFEPSKAIERSEESAGIGNCATWFRLYQRNVATASGLGTGASHADGGCNACACTEAVGTETGHILKANAAQNIVAARSEINLA